MIPLYKTAALEELIARKEAELASKEEKLKNTSENLHNLEFDIYKRNRSDIVYKLVYVSPFCSGLMEPSATREAGHFLGDKVFKVDSSKCLMKAFSDSKAKDTLSKDDYLILEVNVNSISNSLLEKQQNALKEISELSTLYDNNKLFIEYDESQPEELKELDKLLNEINPNFLKSLDKKKVVLQRAKSSIETSFMNTVSEEIEKLKKINWHDK